MQAPAAPADFRPISITAVLSRVMEKLVVRNFIYPAFLTAPLPLSFADQFAFRPSGSTTAAIIALLQKITTLLITNPFVVVIVLDFSKAFDTVRHATLMEKYSMLDLDDCVFNWLNSFFTDHEHCTIFNGIISPFLGINSSVIQGSGIGPASYSVNAPDLRPCTDGNDIVKFADDFDLVIPASNIDSRSAELRHVEVWSVANNLRLNRNKSQEIIFYRPHTRKNKIPQVPEIPGIPRVKSITTLGVVLADSFSMEEHITSVISSSARALYALRILKQHGMNRADLQKVFQSTVISRLQYASPAWWGFTTAAQRDRFEAFLRKSVKTGFYSENSPSFASICDVADDNYLHSVEMNKDHILHSLLPPKVVQHYDMRRRKHNYRLPDKINNLHESNFFIRMFYK